MTTTLRPSGPLQRGTDGVTSRTYDVCVNARPVGVVELETHPRFGPSAGVVRSLRIDEPDRRRGRGTVAALAAEEVLRGWGCTQIITSVPAEAAAALRLTSALGYIERGRNMLKELSGGGPALPAGVEGRPMSEAEFVRWRAAAIESYAQSWTARGVPEDQARAKSEADHREKLPDGLATPGSWLNVLVAQGAVVGHVWVAEHEVRAGERGAYVFDVEVAEEHRGRGHGRALMLLAEQVARAAGTPLIGLHVFAGNTPALNLYESLGYRTTHVNFFKQLL
ncbi:GNAT family N-acetyltransferase [Streptomyces sp. NPDC002889]|uniref:GNAT family N-acetyltransferase n=1 Tax=Streptomyces sp. NPDC002889 TaxID=3364669 RepID=UPI003674333C